MLLKEEKQTSQAISFAIDIPAQVKTTTEDPLIKKRLEADPSVQSAAQLTLEQINDKLKRAEEKRITVRKFLLIIFV
jgi:hypothetical protein